jgi:hypothetical protein
MTDSERIAELEGRLVISNTALLSAIDIASESADINDIRGMKGLELRHQLRLLRQVADYERERLNEECEVVE